MPKLEKKMRLVETDNGNIDLILERDAGNEVRILTGNKSIKFWNDLQTLSQLAIDALEENKFTGAYKGN